LCLYELVKLGYEVRFYDYKEKLSRFINPIRMVIARSKSIRGLVNIFWLNKIDDEVKKSLNSLE
jgi:hypothetical protein